MPAQFGGVRAATRWGRWLVALEADSRAIAVYELDRWVDRYFAPIARPAGTIPRVTAEEPVRTQARHYTVYEASTPLPAVMISYPVPPAAHPDSAHSFRPARR